ncbi:hypothetical protein COV16_04450 [Candidatus Woesearchaeota archaeon CG10_big_fil_rev_8_21_14_0_10_34_8]|nr:MAG: hypothetical protein COV16_04450 [Candidatus Woesearchaeota archaeon CG10_big_fil_rev_8_21_14_0_10_34_8]
MKQEITCTKFKDIDAELRERIGEVAEADNTLVIRIPKNKIKDVFYIKKRKYPNLILFAEEGSSATVIDIDNANNKLEQNFEMHIENNADITFATFQKKKNKMNKKATLKKDSRLHWIDAYFSEIDSYSCTILEKEGACANHTALFLGKESENINLIIETIQKAQHTNAVLNLVGIAKDNSKAFCKGIMKIEKEAYGSTGKQKIKTLLLSSNAKADSIPSMQIDNYDVRATHEASVSQIDKEKLFYMMTRGIDEKEARKKISESFFVPFLKTVPEDVRNRINTYVSKELEA